MTHAYGISNKQYAAVAAGSLAIAVLLCVGIRAGYAAVDEAAAREATAAAQAACAEAEEEAAELEVSPATRTDMSAAREAVEALIAQGLDGAAAGASGDESDAARPQDQAQVAVCVHMLDGSGSFEINGDASMESASMIKLLVLAEYLDEVDTGEVSPTEAYELDSDDVVGGSGTMQDDRPGTAYSLGEVASRMVSVSDNVATNVLIDRMGLADVQEKAAELSLDGTSLVHKLMSTDNDDDLSNTISANDAALILGRIACGTLASDEACDQAENYLLAQDDDEGLVEGLPDGVAFGHKTGTLDDARHDGGIVYAENPYVIVVLTQNIGYDDANDLMEEISAAVYAALA